MAHHGKEGQVKTGSNTTSNVTGFTLETSGDVVEDLRDYLRRRGIKIYTDKPFKSIKPEWL